MIKITSAESFSETCWPLGLSLRKSDNFICKASKLPASFTSEDSKAYGGPQSKDGSGSFYGIFKANFDNPKEIFKFFAPVDCIIRVLTTSHSEMMIESAVYKDNIFESPKAYSKNKSKYGSFIVNVKAQHEPYYLLLSFLIQEQKDCLTYELKISIKPSQELRNTLECKLNKHELLLPPLAISFESSSRVGRDQYAIFDDWIIGNNLPDGVVSNGLKNSKFVYEISFKILKEGLVSIETNYDFLTNDISLEIKDDEVVASGL